MKERILVHIKKHRYIYLLSLISSFVYMRFFSFTLFSSSDWVFEFSETLREIPDFSIWGSYGLGGTNIILWRLWGPNSILFGLFAMLGYDSNVSDKFLVFWPWIFLSVISSYLLVKKITSSEIGGFLGALVLSFNTYFLAINTQGHTFLLTASVFVTFALYFYIRLLETPKYHLSLLTALSLFLAGVNDFRMLYIALWLLFFYLLFFLFCNEGKKRSLSAILPIMGHAASPVIMVVLLNIFWLLPTVLTGSLDENNILGRSLFGNGFLNIEKSLTLFHPFWKDGHIDWFVVQDMPILFWIIPIAAFLGFFLNLKDKNILFFGGLSILGIFLSKQVGYPFPGFYEWMYQHFPGFNAFREASKFYYITALGYSVLIGAFGATVIRVFHKNNLQKTIQIGILLTLSLLFLYNTRPIITGEIGNLFQKREIPGDYLVLKDFLLKEQGFSRTFWVPRPARWGIFTNQHPRLSSVEIIQNEWKQFFPVDPYTLMPIQEQIVQVFKKPFSDSLFDNASIRYVIVPIQEGMIYETLFHDFGGKEDPQVRNWYIGQIDQVPWLKRIDIGTTELIVYENEAYKDKIYLTSTGETLSMPTPSSDVEWHHVHPTEYTVKLNNLSGVKYLNFSEKFHREWRLRIGDFHWFKSLIEPGYYLDDVFHLMSDTSLNSYILDTEYIKNHFPASSFEVNPDGSINVNLTLYFRTQSYFIAGLGISSFTLLILVLYWWYRYRNPKRKRL